MGGLVAVVAGGLDGLDEPLDLRAFLLEALFGLARADGKEHRRGPVVAAGGGVGGRSLEHLELEQAVFFHGRARAGDHLGDLQPGRDGDQPLQRIEGLELLDGNGAGTVLAHQHGGGTLEGRLQEAEAFLVQAGVIEGQLGDFLDDHARTQLAGFNGSSGLSHAAACIPRR